jgi:putative two-component system response regulator
MKILIVEDSVTDAIVVQFALQSNGHDVTIVESGELALEELRRENYQVVITDWELPGIDGLTLCRTVRHRKSHHYTYLIMLTSRDQKNFVIDGLAAGADDYLTKPFEPQELFFRVRVAERLLRLQGRDVLIFSLAKLAESRDPETGAHLERIREYCRLLTDELARTERFASVIDADFAEAIYLTSPLHDIGKVGIPDHILQKPGKLTREEFEIMKLHAQMGGETLDAAARMHPDHAYLLMARDIAFTHHERFDGSGYPKGLKGMEIPLCGRIVALADAYDALTTRRVYKEAYSHEETAQLIVEEAGTHFDPDIVDAFLRCAGEFKRVRDMLDDEAAVARAGVLKPVPLPGILAHAPLANRGVPPGIENVQALAQIPSWRDGFDPPLGLGTR